MKATLTSKGQITIPQAIRKKLNLRAGDVLDFDEDASVLVARRVVEPEEWRSHLDEARRAWSPGALGDRMSTADILSAVRGPVELPPDAREQE